MVSQSHNPKDVWSTINNFLADGKQNELTSITVNQVKITDNELMANAFNDHFCTAVTTITLSFNGHPMYGSYHLNFLSSGFKTYLCMMYLKFFRSYVKKVLVINLYHRGFFVCTLYIFQIRWLCLLTNHSMKKYFLTDLKSPKCSLFSKKEKR